jgi:hypothetical protein
MAEFLINNRETDDALDKGDIVCVRPDGFEWSESEKPKVIKRPGMKYEDAVIYEQALTKQVPSKDDPKIMETQVIKARAYNIGACFIDSKLDMAKTDTIDMAKLSAKVAVAEIN